MLAVAAVIAGRPPTSLDALRLLSEGGLTQRPVTGRQLEILELLSQGRTAAEIGRELYITPSTVRTHVARLASRFGASGKTELTMKAAGILANLRWQQRD